MLCIPQNLLLMALAEEGLINGFLDRSNRSVTRVRVIDENGGLELTSNVNGGIQINVIEANRLDGLNVLKLNNNNIISIDTNTFSFNFNLRNLRILDISYNNLSNINKNLFNDLEHLEELNLNHNFISILSSETFIGLANLKDLNLSGNRLVDLDQNTFRPNLESLVSLNLERNRLKRIIEFLTPTLKKLNLSFNEIEEYDPNALQNLVDLDSLHLDNNRLERILSNLFPKSNQLQFLHLNGNQINEIDADALFECVNLYEINMANNMLYQLDSKLFRLARNENISFRSLRSINLANNQLARIDSGLFRSLYNLEILNLSRNKIEEFGDGCFDDLGELKILQLEYNKFDPDDIDRSLFLNLNPDSILLLTLFDNDIIQTVSSFYKATNDYPYLRSENTQYIIDLFRNYDTLNQTDINLRKPYKADWDIFLKQFSMSMT